MLILAVVKNVLKNLLDYIYPEACPLCSSAVENGSLCNVCRSLLRSGSEMKHVFLSSSVGCYELYAVADFHDSFRMVIHDLKYRALKHYAADVLREGMLSCHSALETVDVVTAVPLHWIRFIQRGYNQSIVLGKAISKDCGIPFCSLLRRTRNNTTQTKKDKDERRKSTQGLFALKDVDIVGKSLIIVDDVCTTGATLKACGDQCIRGGAKSVVFVVLCRVD